MEKYLASQYVDILYSRDVRFNAILEGQFF